MTRQRQRTAGRILLHSLPTPYGFPGLFTYFDAAWLSTVAGLNNGDPILLWEQSAGSGSPLSSVSPPVLAMASGKPAALFDGVSHFLETDASFTVAQPFSLYCLCRLSVLGGCLFDGPGVSLTISGTGALLLNAGTLLTLPAAIAVNTWTAVAVVVNGANSLIRVTYASNSQQISGDAGTNVITAGIRLGADNSGTTFLTGELAQYVCVTQPANPAEIEAFEQYARSWIG
jgi:hypothetical protein